MTLFFKIFAGAFKNKQNLLKKWKGRELNFSLKELNYYLACRFLGGLVPVDENAFGRNTGCIETELEAGPGQCLLPEPRRALLRLLGTRAPVFSSSLSCFSGKSNAARHSGQVACKTMYMRQNFSSSTFGKACICLPIFISNTYPVLDMRQALSHQGTAGEQNRHGPPFRCGCVVDKPIKTSQLECH